MLQGRRHLPVSAACSCRLAEKKRPCMEVGLSFLPATLGPPQTNTHPYSPTFEMCAWPPAFICHGLAISTTVEPKSRVRPAFSKFCAACHLSPLSSNQGDGIIDGNFCSLPLSAYDTPLAT